MKKFMSILIAMILLVMPVAFAEGVIVQDTTIDLTDIVTAALALVAALITRYVIPWIKAKTTLEQQARIQAAIDTVVFAAEKLYGAGKGESKKQYALSKLRAMGYDINDEAVSAGIEAAIMSLDIKQNQVIAEKPPDNA